MQAGTGIRFTINGTEAEVDKVGMADLVAFEKQFNCSSSVLQPPVDPETGEPDGSAVRIEWIAFLVFRAARRQGLIEKTVEFDDDFLEGIDDVDFDEAAADAVAEDTEDPSVPALPPG
jgi:hypothetical protein